MLPWCLGYVHPAAAYVKLSGAKIYTCLWGSQSRICTCFMLEREQQSEDVAQLCGVQKHGWCFDSLSPRVTYLEALLCLTGKKGILAHKADWSHRVLQSLCIQSINWWCCSTNTLRMTYNNNHLSNFQKLHMQFEQHGDCDAKPCVNCSSIHRLACPLIPAGTLLMHVEMLYVMSLTIKDNYMFTTIAWRGLLVESKSTHPFWPLTIHKLQSRLTLPLWHWWF